MTLDPTAGRPSHAVAFVQLCKLAGIASQTAPAQTPPSGDPKRPNHQATKQASGVLSTLRKLRVIMDDGAELLIPLGRAKEGADGQRVAPCRSYKPACSSVLDEWPDPQPGEKQAMAQATQDAQAATNAGSCGGAVAGNRPQLFDLQLVKAAELFAVALTERPVPPIGRNTALSKLAALVTQTPLQAAVPLAQAQQQMAQFLPQRPPVLQASTTAAQASKLPGKSPQCNPINAYGALSTSGEVNGNAAFGAHHNNTVV